MSDNVGSIKISTAEDIGGSLVNVLGGTAYAPKDWKDAINLCGIKASDRAAALAGITPSSGSGTARGTILLNTAEQIGMVLNKKYGTQRGFKPSEWASATSFLSPLPENTASGSVVAINDGAEEVPLKNWKVTLPASLSGYTSVTCKRSGKNLVDGTNFTQGLPSTSIGASIDTITSSTRYAYYGTAIKGGSYTVSSVSNDSDYYNAILIFGYSNGFLSLYTSGTVNGSKTVDLSSCDYVRIAIGTRSASYIVPTDFTDYGTIQLEYGSSSSTYEPYKTPTIKTAQLGTTIYGGEVDVINGSGENTNSEPVTFTGASGENWQFSVSGAKQRVWIYIANAKASSNKLAGNIIAPDSTMSGYPDEGKAWINSSKSLVIGVPSSITSADDWKSYLANNNLQVTYELATTEPLTFSPISFDTMLGNNDFWSDGSDNEIVYRGDLDLQPSRGNPNLIEEGDNNR